MSGKQAKSQRKSKEPPEVLLLREYQVNPNKWVIDIFGDRLAKEFYSLTGKHPLTATGLTVQQEEAFNELGKVVAAKLKQHRGEDMTDEEKAYAAKIGVSIQSGQGTGKDFFGAMAQLWFLFCFANCKNLATANTAKQLKNVYWAELAKIMRLAKRLDPDNPQSPTILEDLFEWQSEKIFLKAKKGKEWFCEAVTINAKSGAEEQATALAGRHEKHMFFVIDEASGVPDPVFRPLEGTLTGKINLVLLIFNPTKRVGYAIDSQRDKRFVALHWNSEKSEVVSAQHVANMAQKYGVGSPVYRIRVKGLPPLADADTLIPFDMVHNAIDKEIEPEERDPFILGFDVGAGGDKSVIAVRHGRKVLKLYKSSLVDTDDLAAWAAGIYDKYEAKAVHVDPIGVGHGVFCRLKNLGYKTFAADVRKVADDPDRFGTKRNEKYWELREMFEEGIISIPDDQDLVDQLATIKVEYLEQGKIKVESKKKMRSDGRQSPDEADAVMLSFWKKDAMFKRKARGRKQGVSLAGVYKRGAA